MRSFRKKVSMNDGVSIMVIAPDGIWRCGFDSRTPTNKLNR